ncbi:hypothetical protein [Streptomyces sp. NPDC059176]|uniref:SCO2400 family protein n=1 Tax=unclassified Streptomyces TaxID=2593676 RepID=UPI0036A3488F
MDYCHLCRRHLNGALACAGCGTPADEIRHRGPVAAADDVVIELGGAYGDDRPPAGRRRAQAPARRKAPAGRRARRKRGRRVLLGTVGLVLAAGALSLAKLATESKGDDGAAVEVREQESIAVDDVPDPTNSAEPPPGPSAVSEAPATSSAPVERRTPGSPGAGEGGDGVRPGTAVAPSRAERSASAPAGSEPSSNDSPTVTSEPSGPSTSPRPSLPVGPPSPKATPSPTETCTWFLFWCT